MPFFFKHFTLSAEPQDVLDLPPGVKITSLKIQAQTGTATISASPQGTTDGYTLEDALGMGTHTLEFSADELKCLTGEQKRLYAAGAGAIINILGVMEY